MDIINDNPEPWVELLEERERAAARIKRIREKATREIAVVYATG